MLAVQYLLGAHEVDDLVGALRPGQRHNPVQIGACDGELRRRRRHLRQPIELAQRFLLHGLGEAGGLDLLAQLVDLARLIVAFAKLLLDRLELLAQEVVTLVLADFRLHLGLDLRPELEHLELLDQEAVEEVEAGPHVQRGQHLLLHLGADGAQAGGDEVGEPAGLGDVDRERLQVVRHQRRQRHDLLEVGLDVALERVDLELVLVADHLGQLGDAGAQVRAHGQDLVETDPGHALDDDPEAAVGQLEHLVDVARRADRVEILLLRIVLGRVALGEHGDHASRGHRLVDQADRTLARHRQRHEGLRKEHGVAERQHRDLLRHVLRQAALIVGHGFDVIAHATLTVDCRS